MQINENALYSAIGERIKRRRVELGRKQTDLARAAGLERTSITNIEKGRQKLPLHLIYRLCEYLELEPRDILPSKADVFLQIVTIELNGQRQDAPPRAAEAVERLLTEMTERR